MTWLKRWWKRLRCLHDYQYDRTLYGDEINHYKYRNIYRCALCGKEYNISYSEKDPHVVFPFRDSLAVVGGREIWCGSLSQFSACQGFVPGTGTVSEASTHSTQCICKYLEPDMGKCLKYPRSRSKE